MLQLLPRDLPNWERNDGTGRKAPFRILATDNAREGCVRDIGSRKGDRFVCVPIGIRAGGLPLEAREALTFTAYHPLTGESIQTGKLRAGERLTLKQGPGAFILLGQVTTRSGDTSPAL
jgi:hypothetical protein